MKSKSPYVSTNYAIAEVKKNNRVCPLPLKWNAMWEILNKNKGNHDDEELLVPLILAAWGITSNLEKIVRLQSQIRWASKSGCLPEVYEFLVNLNEDDWHHLKD